MSASTNDLFPVPSSPPSRLIPAHWPGISSESITALREVLKDNHERWRTYFYDRSLQKYGETSASVAVSLFSGGVYSHCAHRALAIWALGADSAVIQGGYKKDCVNQRPPVDTSVTITAANFNDYVGDRR